jgi:serine protease
MKMNRLQYVWLSGAIFSVILLHLKVAEPVLGMELNPDAPGAANAGAAAEPAKTARIIVKYRESARARLATPEAMADSAEALSRAAGVTLQHIRAGGGNEQILALPEPMSEEDVRAIAERIAQDPDVEYAEPDAIMRIQQAVNDPRFPEQWHYTAPNVSVDVVPAWSVVHGNGVVVAVIDTGFRPHVDLVTHVLPGYDFISDVPTANDGGGRDADASDPGDWCPALGTNSSWHGTHVAGTIAAVTNNGQGVAGIGRDASILPVRVLGVCGGYLSDIADGMRWAAGLSIPGVANNPNRARVLNLSLGGSGPCGPTYADAISAARQAGATVVVAAGNSDSDASGFRPANCDGVITVAATNRVGARAYFGRPGAGSNFGSVVEIAAPGGETWANRSDGILSTLNSGTTTPGTDTYEFYQGTSMATPHVAGVAALIYEAKPTATPDEVLAVLQQTAQPFPVVASRPCDTATCGAGIVSAAAAVGPSPQVSLPWMRALMDQ